MPGGGSFTFDPIRPAAPQEAEQELVIEGIIGGPSGASGGKSGLAYSLPYGPVYSPGVFASSETAMPGLAAPYTVTLAPDRPVYDKNSTVTLSGYYSDIWGNPLAGRPLRLTISNDGFDRIFNVTASTAGRFAAQFVPVPGEV